MDKRKSMLERKSTSVILSVTSLVLIVCLLVVATYSWVDSSNVDTVQTNDMSLNLDTGLDAQWEGSDSSTININGFDLREVSSANGRDFFVPDDSFNDNGSEEPAEQNRTTTDELRFRRANASDVYDGYSERGSNKRFLQFSFSLTTESTDNTRVYLSGLSSINGTGSKFVRLSIDSHDGGDPKIFSNTVIKGYEDKAPVVNAVSSIDNTTGVATNTAPQLLNALNAYTYSNNTPIFSIGANETKKITVSVWLEGASGDFVADEIVDKNDISISLTFTTKMDYTNTLKVVDRTVNNWIKDSDTEGENANLFVIDADGYNVDKPLEELDYYQLSLGSDNKTWVGTIPQNFTSVYIRRYSSETATASWDYWGPLEIPGAAELNSTGTSEQRKNGLNVKYNILGDFAEGTKTIDNKTYDFPTDLNKYSAGLWGDFDDSDFAEIKMFDQFSYDCTDQVGMYAFTRDEVAETAKYIPYVNMQLSYKAYNTQQTVNLRYRMYPDKVNSRLYNANVFKTTGGIKVSNAGIVPYQLGTNSRPGTLVKFGTGWQDNVTKYKYFANTNDSDTSYWGKEIYYLGNGKIYESADQYRDVSYSAYLYKPDTDNKKWISLAKWNMNITESGKTYYAFVLPDGYSNLAYCRMAGSRLQSTEWTNNWETRLNNTEGAVIKTTISKVSIVDSFATRRVYFTYPSTRQSWSTTATLNAYCYNNKDNEDAAWPGKAMSIAKNEKDEELKDMIDQKIYYYDVPGQFENVIFNNSDKKQTANIKLVTNDQYDQFYYDDKGNIQRNNLKDNKINSPTGSSSYKPHIFIDSSEDSVLP